VITAIERTPAIIWRMKDAIFWIDSEGYLIPSRGDTPQLLTIRANSLPAYSLVVDEIKDTEDKFENVIRDKPALKGEMDTLVFFANPKRINGHLLSAILQINAWMPDEPELLYQADRGVGWRDIRGWDVFVGSKLENINDKMLMYETIIRHLDEQGIKPKMVSVEFLHAPYFRLEE